MLSRITIGICLLAAVVEAVLACTSTSRLVPQDALALLSIILPYLILALLSRIHRNYSKRSWFLLALTVYLSAWGIYDFALDSYRYHTQADYRQLQRMAVIIVPSVQLSAVTLAGLALFILGIRSKKKRPTSGS